MGDLLHKNLLQSKELASRFIDLKDLQTWGVGNSLADDIHFWAYAKKGFFIPNLVIKGADYQIFEDVLLKDYMHFVEKFKETLPENAQLPGRELFDWYLERLIL